MSKPKNTIKKRLLSMLLAFVMILGMLPLSALPASAASSFVESPSWTTISGANDSTRMAQLTGYLSRSGTMYIKLGDDIDVNYDLGTAFPVNGVKHLDLNGHKLNYDDRTSEKTRYMFKIESGAEMYIYDSSSKKTGYIHYDGILPKGSEISRSIFVVESGGKLVVNGGEIEAGRSKQIWLAGAGFYNGYVRQQVQGAAIYVASGAECIINGGVIRGRGTSGFSVRRENGRTERIIYSAAVCNEGTLTVNDGFLKGMGDADVIIEKGDTAITNVYSGILDTHKVDVHLYHDDWYEFGHYGTSVTGADKARRTVDYSGGKFDETNDSRRTWNIYGTSSKTAGEYFKIRSHTSVGGVNTGGLPSSWNPNKNYWIGIDIGTNVSNGEYEPYYTYEAAKALAEDYNSETGYQSMATWAVYDSNGNRVSREINVFPSSADSCGHLSKMTSSNLTLNMKDFVAQNGGAISWNYGKMYTLRCTISETWQGQNTWNISNFDEWDFFITNWDTVSVTLNASQAPTTTGNTGDILLERDTVGDFGGLYDQLWSYGYYDTVNGVYQPVWMFQNRGDVKNTLKGIPAGPKKLCVNVHGQTIDGLYQDINSTVNAMVMPRIKTRYQLGASWSDYDYRQNDTFTVSSGKVVQLMGLDASLLCDPADPTKPLTWNGRTISSGNINWQWWNTAAQKWQDIDLTNADLGTSSVTGVSFVEDRNGYYSILQTDRTGLYRAYISCYGKTWYSPNAFKVVGKDYTASGNYKVSAEFDRETSEYNDGTKVRFSVNASDAEWGEWTAGFIIRKDSVPDGAWDYFYDNAYVKYSTTEVQTRYFSKATTNSISTYANFYATSSVSAFFFMNNDKGVIPGKYTLIPVAKAGNGNIARGEPVSIYVEKTATGMDILVNYLNATEGRGTSTDDVPSYVMPANTKTLSLRAGKIPSNATLPNSVDAKWSSSDPYVATVNRDTGEFVANHPGTTRITMVCSGTLKDVEYKYTRYLDIVVPIAEFQFGEVNWQWAVENGKKYYDLTMPITKVRSFEGEWIGNGDKYMEAKCAQVNYLATGEGASISSVIAYNDSMRVRFKVAPKEGYRFYLKPGFVDSLGNVQSYIADTNNIITHAVGKTAMDTAFKIGYISTVGSGNEYYGNSGETPSLCGIYINVEQPCIKDPNVRYLDTVSVTTAEPMEGDSRYQGDAETFVNTNANPNMMDVRVLTMMAEGAPITVMQSIVNKISSISGSGNAYEPISYDDYRYNLSENASVLYPGTGNAKPGTAAELTAPRYEAATYYHEMTLLAGGTGSDGKKVAFGPNVKLFVNGRPVELVINNYNGVGSGYTAERLTVRYYYVSDPSPAFISGTVSGLTAPATGATPVSADDLTVEAVRYSETAGGNVTYDNALYVSRLVWFVDQNGNGKFDEGEETNVLAEDGTFKGNTVYFAYIELAAEENMGRIDNHSFTFVLNTGAGDPAILSSTEAKGSHGFEKTAPPPGVTVSGTVTSFGNDTSDVIIQITAEGASEPTDEKIVHGRSANYSFTGILPGKYTVKVMKTKHAAREYIVTVGTSDVTQDAEIWLYGDVNRDGKVDNRDATQINLYSLYEDSIFDYGTESDKEYRLKVANVTGITLGDNNVDNRDAAQINLYSLYEDSMFDMIP